MKPLSFLFSSVLLVTLCASAGHNPTGSGAAVVPEAKIDNPFLGRDDYPVKLGLAVYKVFDNHQFLRPLIVVRASEAIWFVAERSISPQRFDRLYLRVTPEQMVTAKITPYQFHASDWASLGRVFVNLQPEAELIAAEISKLLKSAEQQMK